MHTNLPIISSAGLFQSRTKFSNPIKYPDNALTRLRTVTDYEIELFTENGGISHLNGVSYPIKKGSLLIAQPGDKRQSTLHFTAVYLHFGTNDEAIQELLRCLHGYHPDMGRYLSVLEGICRIALSFETDSDIDAGARLVSFLCDVKKSCPTSPGDNPSCCSIVSMAVEYMRQSYTEPLTVQKIADHCCLSASHFHRVFLDNTHTTPGHYLLITRLSAAKSLLATTSLPIWQVADKCGFHSQAYFCDCFKRQFGITPREFRNSYIYPDTE